MVEAIERGQDDAARLLLGTGGDGGAVRWSGCPLWLEDAAGRCGRSVRRQ